MGGPNKLVDLNCFHLSTETAMEMVGTSYRGMVSVASSLAGIVGTLLADLFAFLFRDWCYFQICLAVPSFAIIAGYW